jgi:hypothetical protein
VRSNSSVPTRRRHFAWAKKQAAVNLDAGARQFARANSLRRVVLADGAQYLAQRADITK